MSGREWGKAVPALLAALALAGTVAACGGDDESSSSSSGSQSASAGGDCGTVPTQAAKDSAGIIKGLGEAHVAAYNGWGGEIEASPWADFKPKGEPPYTVGVSLEEVVNPFQATFLKAITAELKKDPDVGEVIVKTGDEAVPTQIKQYQSIVDEGADIVLIQPRAPQPFVAPIDAAAKQGVPTISIINRVPTANAINVGPNTWNDVATASAAVLKNAGGKGNYAYVHGIPSTQGDQDAFAGFKATMAACPDAKLAGEINGQYAPPVVKAETLKFLSTHPQKLDGVMITATMAPSIIQAFEQAGRVPVPPVTDVAAQKGSLGYWNQNKAEYKGTGTASGAESMAKAVAAVTAGVLAGRGLKVNDVALPTTAITEENLSEWVEPDWDINTQGDAEGDGTHYVADGYIDKLFETPAS